MRKLWGGRFEGQTDQLIERLNNSLAFDARLRWQDIQGSIAHAAMLGQTGIIPAPEANHAVAGAIREALRAKQEGVSRVILFNLCGHGHFDMQAYIDYHAGKLQNYEYPAEEVAMALAGLPAVEV